MPIYYTVLQNINFAEVKRYAGLSKTDFGEAEMKKACQEVRLLSTPMASWHRYKYNSCNGEIGSTNEHIQGEKIKKYLCNADQLVFLAVTIGETVETAITDYFKRGEYTYALLLDAAATAAVETVADEVSKIIRQAYNKQGYNLLQRYSPGYGDWDISFQPAMIKLCQAEKISLTLTESMMLMPRKSVTAVIGLVPNTIPTLDNSLGCKQCNQKNCTTRKEC